MSDAPHIRGIPRPTPEQIARWREYIAAIGTKGVERAWRRWCEVAA